jgi:hypothetical protein
MGSDWCKGDEEGLSGFGCIVDEAKTFLCDEVCVVLVFVLDWRILVSLEDGREVFVCSRVDEEVLDVRISDEASLLARLVWRTAYGTIESSRIRIVVVVDCMRVEEFPSVVGAVSCFLKPDWEVSVV